MFIEGHVLQVTNITQYKAITKLCKSLT